MSDKNGWFCWDIMQCQKTSNCPAGRNPGTPCWEIASQLNDYRSSMNVCEDCIVFVSKQEDTVLAEQELKDILKQRGVCAFASDCSHYATKATPEG